MKETKRTMAKNAAAKFTLVICAFLNLSAFAVTEEHINKHFAVQPGGELVVDVNMGGIDVSTNGDNEVVVDVVRKIGRSKKADEEAWLKDHPIQFDQSGDTVTVRCRKSQKSSWSFMGRNQNEAKYTITVPSKFNVKLGTSGGGISVIDIAGEIKADTSAGGLKFARLRGVVDGDTSGGGIRMDDCDGKLTLDTSAGGITVTASSGALKADTSGGSITIEKFRGSTRLDTSAGGITLNDVVGQIHAQTSGGGIKASLPARLPEPVNLATSAGGITIHVPSNAAFDVDAETSAGSVTSELPVTIIGKRASDRLKGTVNGGGHDMVLRSSGGSIHVLKSDAVLAEDPR